MLTQEGRINSESIKENITEKKTTLPSLRNQDWKKVKVENGKVNKLITNIPKCCITELDMLIYSGAKLVSDKIGVLIRNQRKNAKPGWEIRLERQIKKLQLQAKGVRREKYVRIYWDKKTRTKKSLKVREAINQNILAKEGRIKI